MCERVYDHPHSRWSLTRFSVRGYGATRQDGGLARLRDLGDCGLSMHLDTAVEQGAILHHNRRPGQQSLYVRRRRELDSIGAGDVAHERAVNRDARALDVTLDVGFGRHHERTLSHADVPIDTAVDGDILLARDVAGNDKRRSNSGHVLDNPEGVTGVMAVVSAVSGPVISGSSGILELSHRKRPEW